MSRFFAVLAALALVGCGSTQDAGTAAPRSSQATLVVAEPAGTTHDGSWSSTCRTEVGHYRWTYERTSGECDDIPGLVQTVTGAPIPESCTGNYSESPNGCETDVVMRCPYVGGSKIRMAIHGFKSAQNERGEGSMRVDATNVDGSPLCGSDYRLSWVRVPF